MYSAVHFSCTTHSSHYSYFPLSTMQYNFIFLVDMAITFEKILLSEQAGD